MKDILTIAKITFIGGRRDKVFLTLIIISVLIFPLIIFAISPLSMRQVREVAVSLSLSTISIVLLILSIFLGINLVYKDIERKFSHTVLSLPVSRQSYLIGKFIGLAGIIGVGVITLTIFSSIGIAIVDTMYTQNTVMSWTNFYAAILFDYLSLLILVAVSILVSTISTNIFSPLFITLAVYIIGYISQTVYDYIISPKGVELPKFIGIISKAVYYIFPNFTLFDIKFKAIYGIHLEINNILNVTAYSLLYLVILLSIAIVAFRKREML
ncbi:MAG: ABC transporter permease subunit [Nitrospirae bacterium]|nr:ABC transporter permease subunit [Nitrospirota bacterium]MBF0540217.1 ABC transporter permease subunit [Nitrospirota bacterium]